MKALRWIVVGLLATVAVVALIARWVLATESGSAWLTGHAAARLPGLSVGKVSGSLLAGLRLGALRYRAGDGTELDIGEVSVAWRSSALRQGELAFSSLRVQDVRLRLAPSESPEAITVPAFSVPLPVRIDALSLRQAELRSGDDKWALVSLQARVAMAGENIEVTDIQLSGEGLQLAGGARFSGAAPHALATTLDWSLRREDLPELAGRLTVSGDLQALEVEQRVSGPFRADLVGRVWPDWVGHAHRFELQGQWADVKLPLADGELRSDQGRATLSGLADDYRLTLETRLHHPDSGEATLQLQGQGDTARFQVTDALLQAWGGEATLAGELTWSPRPTWDLVVTGRKVNPGVRWPAWPGDLNWEVAMTGELGADGPALALVIRRLDGRLRDYPISGQGEVMLRQGGWQARRFALRSGDNRLAVDGRLLPRLDLDVQLDAPDLAALLPQLRGTLRGSGHARGTLEQLAVQLDVQGSGLEAAGMQVGELLVNADVDPTNAQGSRWQVNTTAVRYADWQAESLQIQGRGNAAQHSFQASLRSDKGDVDLAGSGAYRATAWRGQLQALTLMRGDLGLWSLQSPAMLHVGTDDYRVARSCLIQDDAQLCLEASGSGGGDLEAEAQWQAVPLSLLEPLLARDAQLSGTAAGSATLRRTRGSLAGEGKLRTSPGRVRFLSDTGPEVIAEHRQGSADFSYRDDRLAVEGTLLVGDAGRMAWRGSLGSEAAGRPIAGELQLTLPDVAPLAVLVPEVSDLSGTFDVRSSLYGSLEKPRVEVAGGWRDGAAKVPALGIELTDLELLLRGDEDRLDLTGSVSSGPGKLQLQGRLQLDPALGWPLRLSIEGQDFEIARRTDVEGRISPDLRLEARAGSIAANGKLVVPYARVTGAERKRGRVHSSPDEIIVDEGQPVQAATKPAATAVSADVELVFGDDVSLDAYGLTSRVTGTLRLHQTAGSPPEGVGRLQLEDGRYKAYGQDLTIESGRLLFSGPLQNPELDVRAVRKAGTVTAGILLSGSLQQPKVALFSEPPMEQADVLSYLVTGKPRSSAGQQTDSSLLTGAALGLALDESSALTGELGERLGFDELSLESGTEGLESSAMAIGKQLSPDLYLRYLYGLFDSSASLQIRYLMTERLRLEGQTGAGQSVDLIYELERD